MKSLRQSLIIFGLILTVLGLSACGGSSGSSGSSTEYRYVCDPSDTYDYSAKYTHTVSHTTASRQGTVIFMHGKTGWPYSALYYDDFFNALAGAGYDVQSLQMPWATFDWDGSSCQGLNLIQEKATEFKVDGEKLILVGHSLGGAHVQILAAMDSAKDIDGIVTLAPGHMPHLLAGFQNQVAGNVSTARQLVANNQGSVIGTYQTPNNGSIQSISLSAENYLSYHDTDVFADHRQLYPKNRFPLLWIGGSEDNLTSVYSYRSNFNNTSNPTAKNQYIVVSGNHIGMIANSSDRVLSWINTL